MKKIALAIVGTGVFSLAATTEAADVKLLVEPSYPPDQAAEVYKPLIDYLNSSTGHTVTLVAPRNHIFFWREIRNNAPIDLVFAEAHFTDYRITKFKAEPLARAAGKQSYTLAGTDQLKVTDLNGLVGRNIVTMQSPSLGFAVLLEFFPSPIAQPNILSIASSWKDGIEIMFAGEADAAIMPTVLQKEYSNLIPLRTSREFPGPAFTASAELDPQIKADIKAALLKLHENAEAYDALNELGISQFVETTPAEFAGLEHILREFFGYQEAAAPAP
ncbi:MAG TPA: PhnD/SsuA/transferrin family substrate-binding protein [Candidatus Saccharimonadia bacterium]|nr:PhnD/SsuA/transferrin family substrate-binding protein [Candidatus Saccharimonadia bacterium]